MRQRAVLPVGWVSTVCAIRMGRWKSSRDRGSAGAFLIAWIASSVYELQGWWAVRDAAEAVQRRVKVAVVVVVAVVKDGCICVRQE